MRIDFFGMKANGETGLNMVKIQNVILLITLEIN